MVKLIMCVLSEIRRKGTVFIHRYGARVAIHVLLKKVFICDLLWHTREQVSWTQLHALLKKRYTFVTYCGTQWNKSPGHNYMLFWKKRYTFATYSGIQGNKSLGHNYMLFWKKVYICDLLWHTMKQVSWTKLHALFKKKGIHLWPTLAHKGTSLLDTIYMLFWKKVYICDLLWQSREQVSWTQFTCSFEKKVYICDLLWQSRELVAWTSVSFYI